MIKQSQLNELVKFLVKRTLNEMGMDSALSADPMTPTALQPLQTDPIADPMKQQKAQRDARKAQLDKAKTDTKDLHQKDKIQKTNSTMWKRQKRQAEKEINATKMAANSMR